MEGIRIEDRLVVRFPGRDPSFRAGVEIGMLATLMALRTPEFAHLSPPTISTRPRRWRGSLAIIFLPPSRRAWHHAGDVRHRPTPTAAEVGRSFDRTCLERLSFLFLSAGL